MRDLRRLLAIAALCVAGSGCAVYSSGHPRLARRPAGEKTCEPRNVECSPSGSLCSWEGCDGALIFGVDAETPPL